MYIFEYKKGLQLEYIQVFVSQEFTPPHLLRGVNIDIYTNKLSLYANFLICNEKGVDIGFIAFYENREQNVIYITLIAVRQGLQHKGVGSKMMDKLVSSYQDTEFRGIKLEVDKDNTNAYLFYLKHNFYLIEDRKTKLLMGKDI